MFVWTEKELNPEQTDAILLQNSVFLIACPGSGKTRTLTYKIAHELSQEQSDRRYVVAITYTHRAADEIRERVEDLGVDVSRLWIGTIHAFCLEWIIKPYSVYEPALANGYRIIDQHDRERLLERLCAPYRSYGVTHYDCDYYFTTHGYYLGCPAATKHPHIQKVLEQYFSELSEAKQIDFELILWYAHGLITRNSAIAKILSNLFSYVLVDEYQDTKKIQYEIVGSILRAGEGATRLFMVGDPNQAIYGSLGGYPISFGDLKDLIGIPVEERELSQNYRSSARIVEFFGHFNAYDTTIVAEGRDRDYPSSITYDATVDRDHLVHEIARVIRHNVNDLGIPPNEICVVAPQWLHLAAMTRRLVTAVPELQFDGPGMVPFARDTENFWYRLSRLVLTDPSPSLYTRRLRWAGEVIKDLTEAGVSLNGINRKSLLRLLNGIEVDDSDGLTFLRSSFDQFASELGISLSDHALLDEHYRAFFAASELRVGKLELDGVAGVRETSFFRKVFQNRSGVTVSTIHGVKGAEFDVVVAYALLQGMVPHFNDADGDLSAKKLVYVVGSRARKNLHMFSEVGRPRGRYDVYGPTKVLASCAFNYDVL